MWKKRRRAITPGFHNLYLERMVAEFGEANRNLVGSSAIVRLVRLVRLGRLVERMVAEFGEANRNLVWSSAIVRLVRLV